MRSLAAAIATAATAAADTLHSPAHPLLHPLPTRCPPAATRCPSTAHQMSIRCPPTAHQMPIRCPPTALPLPTHCTAPAHPLPTLPAPAGCHGPAQAQGAQQHDVQALIAAAGSAAGAKSDATPPLLHTPPPLPLPWQPLLTPAQLKRGLAFYGSGERMEAVAARLLAGQPITAVTLGASITRGHGASAPDMRFPMRFFHFLNASFPHRWVGRLGGSAGVCLFDIGCLSDQLNAGAAGALP